jgi:hypothetical protein
LGGGCLLWASPVAPFSCGEAEGKLPPGLSRLVRGTSAGGRSGLWRCCPLGARGGRQLQAVLVCWQPGSADEQQRSDHGRSQLEQRQQQGREREQKQGRNGGRGPRAVNNQQEQDQGAGAGPGAAAGAGAGPGAGGELEQEQAGSASRSKGRQNTAAQQLSPSASPPAAAIACVAAWQR